MSVHPETNFKCEYCICAKEKIIDCRNNTPKIFCPPQEKYIATLLCFGENCNLRKRGAIKCHLNTI